MVGVWSFQVKILAKGSSRLDVIHNGKYPSLTFWLHVCAVAFIKSTHNNAIQFLDVFRTKVLNESPQFTWEGGVRGVVTLPLLGGMP